jgi:hypothetical protein
MAKMGKSRIKNAVEKYVKLCLNNNYLRQDERDVLFLARRDGSPPR